MALEAGARLLIAYSDSQLIIKQVEGTNEVKKATMVEYIRKITELKVKFEMFNPTKFFEEK
ncbi:UNVERIFIED_CONTAM: hypothetical protein Sangu_2854000 [Sesamum angustifolium]|uniref:RNase H type-1 domain-containing protein n=1 Tax=Sesamum angustifolium TaxID=2727405 RepID=A0AAW2INN2_9LAMI